MRGASIIRCHPTVCCLQSPKICPVAAFDPLLFLILLGLNVLNTIRFFLRVCLIYFQCSSLHVYFLWILAVCGSSACCHILWELSKIQAQQKRCTTAELTISLVVLMFNLLHPCSMSPEIGRAHV